MRIALEFLALSACTSLVGGTGSNGGDGSKSGDNGRNGEVTGPGQVQQPQECAAVTCIGATGLRGEKGDKGDVGTAGTDGTRNGTRIKARYVTTSDGYSAPYGNLRDTERNDDCYFTYAADEQFRCLPMPGAAYTGSYWSDAGCTTTPLAIILTNVCATPAKYAYKQELAVSCAAPYRYRIFELGAKLPSGTAVRTSSPSTPCSAAAPVPGYDVYSVVGEVPPSSFQSGTHAY